MLPVLHLLCESAISKGLGTTSSFIVLVMNQSSLDRLLQQRREKPAPALQGSFSQNVWREIHQRKAASDPAGASVSLWHWLLRPQIVLAALTLAIAVGVAVGAGNWAPVSQAAQTREALDLEVFGRDASSLPSTLLANNL